MRLAASLAFSSVALYGQSVLDSSKVALVAKYFERQSGDRPLRCEVNLVRPQLTFSLNFQTGYVFRVPLNQYFGPGHLWGILTRVTPDAGGDPVYLSSAVRLPNIPKSKVKAESGGAYLIGEGGYKVEWLLFDDSNRTCRKNWHVEAKRGPNDRGLGVGMKPNTVAAFSFRRWSSQTGKNADVRTLRRLTVLLHAAPLFPNSNRLRGYDRMLLLGSLASLLESLPARSVRMVVFNLDQQKELLREDNFTPEVFDSVAQSMNGMELQLVSYRVLTNQRGHLNLLADLVNQELRATDPSEAVIFLGPASRYFDKFPQEAIEERSTAGPPFFYLQYRPFFRPNPRRDATAEFPDSIQFALKTVRGKTISIHTPDEFAKAIKQVEAQVSGEK
jgi:hypothetical protein